MFVTIEITRVSVLGQGVGADSEGNIFFVPGALPGDTVKAKVVSHDKKYFECELEEVVTPSPERIVPECEYFQRCGGCDWLHWNYADQLKGKEKIVLHALERASLFPKELHPILGAKDPFHYRNRIQLRQGNNQLGFFKKKSHELVDIEKCQVAHPKLNAAIAEIRQKGLSPSSELQKLELYLDSEGKVRQVTNAEHGAEGFRQINEAQNLVLQNKVYDYVRKSKASNVLELYCGNGNFTFHYLREVDKVIGIDANPLAIEDAKARRSSVGQASAATKTAFFCALVDKSTPKKLPPEFGELYDTLIVDPPRNGMAGSLASFIHPKLETVIYISCSAQSFSQDAQSLKKQFTFEELQPVDMFPHTRHVEFVARFTRLPSS